MKKKLVSEKEIALWELKELEKVKKEKDLIGNLKDLNLHIKKLKEKVA